MQHHVRPIAAGVCLWLLLLVVSAFPGLAHASFAQTTAYTSTIAHYGSVGHGSTPMAACSQAFSLEIAASNANSPGGNYGGTMVSAADSLCKANVTSSYGGAVWTWAYSQDPLCPSGSSVSGSSCTCNAPSVENASHTGCVAQNLCGNMTGTNAGPWQGPLLAGSVSDPKYLCTGGGPNNDQNISGDPAKPGCLVVANPDMAAPNASGVMTWSAVHTSFTGASCAFTDGNMASATPQVAACPSGQVSGTVTVNGVAQPYCYVPDLTNRPYERTGTGSTTTRNPDGTSTDTGTKKDLVCTGTSCTTTTTTTITNRDSMGLPIGSPVTTTSTATCDRSQPGCGNIGASTPTTTTTNTTSVSSTSPTGATNTTSTSTTSGGGSGSGSGDNQPTECDVHPDTVGCMKPGLPGGTDTLGSSQVNIGATSTVGFAASQGCPMPLTFALRGQTYAVSYQPVCDRLALLKALFLAMAAVLSAYIIADGFKV